MEQGPRIYNLFPLLAGTVPQWQGHLPRIAGMGFDWVYLNPFHFPGFSGSLYAVKDYYRLNPLFHGDAPEPGEVLLRDFLDDAHRHGLRVMMDLVVNHTGKDSVLVGEHPEWFKKNPDGSIRSPGAVDPDDPETFTEWGDLAEIDYDSEAARAGLIETWRALAIHYVRLGFDGFRCDAAYKVPAEVWSAIISAVEAVEPETVFMAETLGCTTEETEALRHAGFHYLFNSAKWWDFRADWLLEQYETNRHIAPSIAFPESHDTDRLVNEVPDGEDVLAHYRLRTLFSAFFSAGWMMPMGFEYGFAKPLHVVETRPRDWEDKRFDLSDFIAAVNRVKAETPALNFEGPMRRLTLADDPMLVLARHGRALGQVAVAAINLQPDRPLQVDLATLLHGADMTVAMLEDATPGAEGREVPEKLDLQPLEMRLLRSRAGGGRVREESGEAGKPQDPVMAELGSRPILIQAVWPEIDGGRYAVKREVGDALEVSADIFKDGHDTLAAAVLYREKHGVRWQEAPMRLVDNDRWAGSVPLRRNTRYVYTIEAWVDRFETWRSELAKKMDAGQAVSVELDEGRQLVEEALARVEEDDHERLRRILHDVDAAENDDDRAAILQSTLLRRIMARNPDRREAVRYDRELEVVVDRVAARFAAWYEMMARSQGTQPGKSATFKDCEKRLPEIRAMGFDVLYLLPIHPIGRVHRKGPNNSLVAGPNDPGSPYAIGAKEGGHKAVHPELGTLADFRRLVARARELGMEVALDFAIQCAPDHPYVKEHPEWFVFRPDGSIKYAENPPKKYQDIVNVNFHGPHARALWEEWLDVVLFWVGQGVTIFRVDNPHTKPVPFWEWLIRRVQDEHPEVIFLSEAFTRPKMMKTLAKAGFTQSYTYFTWRNFKQELTDYLTELSQSESKEYFRPNFFPTTPDILPFYLQTGGRPAFVIRFVLAATLSSVYGLYNGYELCENAAIPGKEEYLNSEKYEYKVWDWDRPGNIKDVIARVNRIRRENPALHEFENLRFYDSDDDSVLFYGKMTLDRSNMVFVAVNLDPFDAREAELRFPLDDMGVPPGETFEVEELLSGRRHLWRGARHTVRLDPQVNPAEIYRVTVWTSVDYRTPCM